MASILNEIIEAILLSVYFSYTGKSPNAFCVKTGIVGMLGSVGLSIKTTDKMFVITNGLDHIVSVCLDDSGTGLMVTPAAILLKVQQYLGGT